MKKFNFLIALVLSFLTSMSQVTTSSISGGVKSADGKPLETASIIVKNISSGTEYGNASRKDGRFNIMGMRVGGPYTITISYSGYENYVEENVYLTLGKDYKVDVKLTSKLAAMKEVVVTASKIFNSDRTGTGTNIDKKKIENLPTVSRNFEDFTRLTPQANFRNGNLTVAGLGNRFNDLRIDGAYNSDPYGRNPNGQNGGQTAVNPISIDAIEQVQVNLSPYDITQSGFGGASINAVTRSGSNKFSGSIYHFFRNENISGKTPVDNDTDSRSKLSSFSTLQSGFRLGGPIVKDKLFFFINGEIGSSDAPLQYKPGTSQSVIPVSAMDSVRNRLSSAFGYNPGAWENVSGIPQNYKVLGRLDWNINKKHSLMFRFHSTQGNSITNILRTNVRAQFENLPRAQVSTTNSFSLEINSTISSKMSNTFRLTSTWVDDKRQPKDGVLFPAIDIQSTTYRIEAGGYPDIDRLKNNVTTLTDNLIFYKGKHTITSGFQLEKTYTYSQRVPQNYGYYRYASVKDFVAGKLFSVARSYPKSGNPADITADFNFYNSSIYGQDEIQATDNLKLSYGLRIDIPMMPTDARSIQGIDTSSLFSGYKTGVMSKTKLHWNPRVAFNYDVNGKGKTQLRGGTGFFMGRINSSTFAGMFQENGLLASYSVKATTANPLRFEPNPLLQPTYSQLTGLPEATARYQVNLIDHDRKFLQLLRSNFAVDQKLPGGIVATFEVMYSKLFNDNNFTNLNLGKPVGTLAGADNRPYYSTATPVDARYNEVTYISSQSDAHSFTTTLQLQKNFKNGVSTSFAYTNTSAKNKFESVSVFNTTNWQRQLHINGLNNLEPAISRDQIAHHFIGVFSYTFNKWVFKNHNLKINAVYSGSSGTPFSYVYSGDPIDVTTNDQSNTLIYIPRNSGEIVLKDPTKWDALNRFIDNDDYLRKNRGGYAQRNGPKMPWEHNIDLRIAQDINFRINKKKQTVQITFDVANFTNMLNKKWGHRYTEAGPGFYEVLKFEGYVTGTKQPIYSFSDTQPHGYIINDNVTEVLSGSRWLGQFGIRYSF
jgi:hypothetical protein